MKISIEDILKYDPFDEDDWDEIESRLYELYYQGGKMCVDHIGECCGKVCEDGMIGINFSDDVDRFLITRTYKRFYRRIIYTHSYSIFRINEDIDTIKNKYKENKRILSELKSNEMGVIDIITNTVKIGRIKHIRGNRWIGVGEDRIPSLSDEEFTKLKEDGFLLKNYRYYVYNYNKKLDNKLLKELNLSNERYQNRIIEIKKTIKKLENNYENLNFDILDTILNKKT